MKVYILQEEWINPMDYSTEKAFSTQIDVFETFEAAEKEWTERSNRRRERVGQCLAPTDKEDINANGISVRYYSMRYPSEISFLYGEEVMIKTTIAERTVL